jgi:hypothetical protein
MDYAGNIAQDRQQDIDPEVLADPYLQKHAQGREKYSYYDAQQIHQHLLDIDLPSYYVGRPLIVAALIFY